MVDVIDVIGIKVFGQKRYDPLLENTGKNSYRSLTAQRFSSQKA